MSSFLSAAVMVTLGCYAFAGAVTVARLLRGPSALDRVLALDYLYLVGMVITLALGIGFGSTVSFEAALLISLFGFVSSTALAKFVLRGEVIE